MATKKLPYFTTAARELYDETFVKLGKKTKELFKAELIKEFGNRGDNYLMSFPEVQAVITKLKL